MAGGGDAEQLLRGLLQAASEQEVGQSIARMAASEQQRLLHYLQHTLRRLPSAAQPDTYGDAYAPPQTPNNPQLTEGAVPVRAGPHQQVSLKHCTLGKFKYVILNEHCIQRGDLLFCQDSFTSTSKHTPLTSTEQLTEVFCKYLLSRSAGWIAADSVCGRISRSGTAEGAPGGRVRGVRAAIVSRAERLGLHRAVLPVLPLHLRSPSSHTEMQPVHLQQVKSSLKLLAR